MGIKIERRVLCCVLFTFAEFIYCPMSGDVTDMNGGSPGPLKMG